jgi:hypothetical protein
MRPSARSAALSKWCDTNGSLHVFQTSYGSGSNYLDR